MDLYARQCISSFPLSYSELGVLNLLGITYPSIKQSGWFQHMIPVESAPLLYSHTLYLYNVFDFFF